MAVQGRKPDKEVQVWQPFQEIEEMERHLDDYVGWPLGRTLWRRRPLAEMWAPAMDVIEKDDKYLVKLELPGVREEDVDISISGDMLTVSGEKKSESDVKKKGYHYTESSYGSFSRSISLPTNVKSDKIEADFDNGILEITLPKSPEVQSKKISIAAKKKEVKK